MIEFKIHPACNIFPHLDEAALDALKVSIKSEGQLEPIALLDGMLIDGRARAAICDELGLDPVTAMVTDQEPITYVIARNGLRRHLTPGQRAIIAAKIAQMKVGDNQYRSSGLPIGEASRLLSVSSRSVSRARKIIERGIPEIVHRVSQGKLSLHGAERCCGNAHESRRVPLETEVHPESVSTGQVQGQSSVADGGAFETLTRTWLESLDFVAAWKAADDVSRRRFIDDVLWALPTDSHMPACVEQSPNESHLSIAPKTNSDGQKLSNQRVVERPRAAERSLYTRASPASDRRFDLMGLTRPRPTRLDR